jgi:hypothetical protein
LGDHVGGRRSARPDAPDRVIGAACRENKGIWIPSARPFRGLDTAAPRQFVHCPQKYFAGGVSSRRLGRKANITSKRSKKNCADQSDRMRAPITTERAAPQS